jgi:hypothetical protein
MTQATCRSLAGQSSASGLGHGLGHAPLPLLARRVAVELDLVAVRISGVQRAGHAVVGGPLEEAALGEEAVCLLDGRPVGQLHRDVVQADGRRHRRRRGVADPQQRKVVVVLAGRGEEDHDVAHLARDAEAQQVAVEGERPIQVAHLQHDMTYPDRMKHPPMLPQPPLESTSTLSV